MSLQSVTEHIQATLTYLAENCEFRLRFNTKVAEAALRFHVPYCLHYLRGDAGNWIALSVKKLQKQTDQDRDDADCDREFIAVGE